MLSGGRGVQRGGIQPWRKAMAVPSTRRLKKSVTLIRPAHRTSRASLSRATTHYVCCDLSFNPLKADLTYGVFEKTCCGRIVHVFNENKVNFAFNKT